ncbi:MAG: hypothetical protein AAF617_15960, partial [Bacteroidota bacterium]
LSATQESNDFELDVTGRFESIDLSAALGTSYRFDNGLNLGVRYHTSITSMINQEGRAPSFYNGVLQFSIGYFFK